MVQPHKLWLGFQQKVFFLIVLLGDQAVFIARSAQFSVLGNSCGIANHRRGTDHKSHFGSLPDANTAALFSPSKLQI